jgi:hypothetical protein
VIERPTVPTDPARGGTAALASLVVAPSPGVGAVAARGGGALLVDEPGDRVVPLNRTGALVWACLDGESTLGEIAADLADGFGISRHEASADVEALAARLLDLRMIEGQGDAPAAPDPRRTPACCPHGDFPVARAHHDHVHALVDDGVWLAEPADSCRDARYLLGEQGEVVARLHAPDGTERLVGIRTNDVDVAAAVRERLGPLLADDEPFGFPNISILLGARTGRVRDVDVVVRRTVRAFHTFSPDEAIDAAMALLPTFLPVPAGLTSLHARALERQGSVVLVADVFAGVLDAERRRISAAGYAVTAPTPVLVDPVAAVAHLPAATDLTRDLVACPISHVVVTGVPPDHTVPDAFDLARIAPLVCSTEHPVQRDDFAALADLAAAVPLVWVPAIDRRQLVGALLGDALLGDAPLGV